MTQATIPLFFEDQNLQVYADDSTSRGMAFVYNFPHLKHRFLNDFGKGFGRVTGATEPGIVRQYANFLKSLPHDSQDETVDAFLTHGHYDHLYGLPELVGLIPLRVHGSVYSHHLLRHLMGERPRADFTPNVLREREGIIDMGRVRLRFFPVIHSMPQTRGFVVEYPRRYLPNKLGRSLFVSEFRTQEPSCTPGLSHEMLDAIERYGPYDSVFYDGLRAGQPGVTPSEEVLREPLRRILAKVPGDVLVPIISSKVALISLLDEEIRKTDDWILDARGGSMIRTFDRCHDAGWISPAPGIRERRGKRLLIVGTGSQSEDDSYMDRLRKGTSREIMANDTIAVFQAPIPMHRKAIAQMYRELAKRVPDGAILMPRRVLQTLRLRGENIHAIEDYVGLEEDLELPSGHGKDGDHRIVVARAQVHGPAGVIKPFQVDKSGVDPVDDGGEVVEVPSRIVTPAASMSLSSLVDIHFKTLRTSA